MISVAIDSLVPIRAEASDRAEQVSELLFGEAVHVLNSSGNWAFIECLHDHYRGYADIRMFEPVNRLPSRFRRLAAPAHAMLNQLPIQLPADALFPFSQAAFRTWHIGKKVIQLEQDAVFLELPKVPSPADLLNHATSFLGTPYRWGGRSRYGIDCSGFVQQVFSAFGIHLPRDAWQQAEIGKTVYYLNRKPGDLAFFTNANGKIVHVGIVSNGHEFLHASVRVRRDMLFSTGVYSPEYRKETHSLYLIKRIW